MARMGFHKIQGKSRGSVRESGDSVERLEECSGARACTFGELGARGVRLGRTRRAAGVYGRHAGGVRRAGRVRKRAGRATGEQRACGARSGRARVRSGRVRARLARGSVRLQVHCSPESTSFTRNDGIDLKS
ncbi:hypothetical protein CRG98_011990 [Punica granatum]|uniref:Uncharacterized protein n=1 Tax=Punica granatum TaxID=22663 RepID=A0A2I0KH14_PUNGR|nr:hypothetical protein CRG98_011990 [Punica granatum]